MAGASLGRCPLLFLLLAAAAPSPQEKEAELAGGAEGEPRIPRCFSARRRIGEAAPATVIRPGAALRPLSEARPVPLPLVAPGASPRQADRGGKAVSGKSLCCFPWQEAQTGRRLGGSKGPHAARALWYLVWSFFLGTSASEGWASAHVLRGRVWPPWLPFLGQGAGLQGRLQAGTLSCSSLNRVLASSLPSFLPDTHV